MAKKNKRKVVKTRQVAQPKTEKKYKYNDALITTFFALGGIYSTFILASLIKGSNATSNLYQAQSLLGGLFANLFAVVGVAYSKFAKEMFVHRNVYWLSLASFVILISIFAQARVMYDPSISLIMDWLKSPYVSIALQIGLAILIFKIVAQKELNVRTSYNKKKLV